MSALSREQFARNLDAATARAREGAEELCINEIPGRSAYWIVLNQSYDGNLEPGEKLFPDHGVPQKDVDILYAAEDVVARLWREKYVPEWIDITPRQVVDGTCCFELLCCGRFTNSIEKLYHRNAGYPPFHVTVMLPKGWESLERDGKFDLHDPRWQPPKNGA